MTEDQLTRFEFFVRSHLPRARVKDILTNALGSKYNITDEMAIVVCGLAKLFIGEITEIGMYTFNLRQAISGFVRSLFSFYHSV